MAASDGKDLTRGRPPYPVASLREVEVFYGDSPALCANLELTEGVHAVVGANGAGKTTLLRALTGLITPRKGDVEVLGGDPADSPQVRARIGYFGHRLGLYPELTVRDNLLYWCRVLGVKRSDEQARAEAFAREVSIDDELLTSVGALSRGQRLRVALARTLLHNPEILLLDEPTAGLDPVVTARVGALISDIGRKRRLALLATHDLTEAQGLADMIVVLSKGNVVGHQPVGGFADERSRVWLKTSGDPRPALATHGYRVVPDGESWRIDGIKKDGVPHLVRVLVEGDVGVLQVDTVGDPLGDLLEELEDE